MLKRTGTFLMALVLSISVLPVRVNAESKTEEKVNVVHAEKGNAKVGEIGAGALIDIEAEAGEEAEMLNGTYGDLAYEISNGEVTITGIANGGDDEYASSLVIPAEIEGYPVTSIGDNAFANSSLLTDITIPESVTSIGKSAFYTCSSLKSITIPDGVTRLDDCTFQNCGSLASIKLPSRLTTIGEHTFHSCENLIKITIPNGVTSIGNYAFYGCYSLTGITIPNGIPSIGNSAFCECYDLTDITIPASVTSIGESAFYRCRNLISIKIPDNVTSIGEFAFSGCNSLANVTIGNSVKSIGNSAFSDCDNLISITIPNSVTAIGDSVCQYCISLASVTIGNSVTSIGNSAFWGCRSLTNITIPDSVTSIGEWAFHECSSLTKATIGNGVTSIGAYAFLDCRNLATLTIGNRVKSIDLCAFENCESLTRITIPNSVTSIGDLAFSGCSSLTGVTMSYGITSIGSSAFSGCTSLTRVTIPDSVTSIGDSAFLDCSNMTAATIGNSVLSIGVSAFKNCSNLTSVIIGNSVTSIGDSAFSGCGKLADITIPDSVTSIGDSAFLDCSNMTAATIGNNVSSIGRSAFQNCSNLASVAIGNHVKSIEHSAFFGCSSLKNFTIPTSVTYIGYHAFSGCSSLTSIKIPVSVTRIEDYTFQNCRSLKSVIIPASVTTIGYCAFSGCSSLSGITIPDSVTSISNSAFSGCSSLTSVTIPSDVRSIGGKAFYECSSLITVTIGSSVESIEALAFGGCNKLQKVYFRGGAPIIRDDTFLNDLIITAYYPENSLSWTEDKFQNYGAESIIWESWKPDHSENERSYAVYINNRDLVFIRSENNYENNKEQTVIDIDNNEYTGTVYTGFENTIYKSQDEVPWNDKAQTIRKVYVAEGQVIKPISMNYWCSGFGSLESFDGTGFDTSDTTSMQGLFWMAGGLDSSLDLKSLNTSNVTNMSMMFQNAYFKSLDLSNFDTSSVENMQDMFSLATRLKSITLGTGFTKWHIAGALGDEKTLWEHNGMVRNAIQLCREYPSHAEEWSGEWVRYEGEDYSIPKAPVSQSGEEFRFCSQFSDDGLSYTYDYDENWFFKDTKTYNHDLALMSLKMAMASYSDKSHTFSDNITNLYEKIGIPYPLIECNYPIPENNTVGYTIGAKNIIKDGKIITLIPVTIRSGGYGNEWGGNFEVGLSDDHSGFDQAAYTTLKALQKYINSHDSFIRGDIKVWISGFSRGAAIANLIGKHLDEGEISGISSEDVFAYGFECPRNTSSLNAWNPFDDSYDNIFSIVNVNDMVPMVAPVKWGYTRYGHTYVIHNDLTGSIPAYWKRYKPAMLKKYEKILEYNGISNTSTLVDVAALEKDNQAYYLDSLITCITDLIGDSSDYTSGYQTIVQSIARRYLGSDTEIEVPLEALKELFEVIYKNKAEGAVKDFLKEVIIGLETGVVGTIIEAFKICQYGAAGAGAALFVDAPYEKLDGHHIAVLRAHYPELCLAWMEAYKDYGWKFHDSIIQSNVSIQSVNAADEQDNDAVPSTYRLLTVSNSANISIYDKKDGSLLATVKNGEAEEIEYGLSSYTEEDGRRIFIIPSVYECEVVIEPTEDGTMTYTCSEHNVIDGQTDKVVSYINVDVSEGETYTGTIERIDVDEDAGIYELEKGNQIIDPDINSAGDAITKHTVTVTVEGEGTAFGGGEYLVGEYAGLTVVEGAENFLGWYDESDNLLSEDVQYSIVVTEDKNITARFETKPSVSVELNKSELTLRVGKNETLIARVIPEGTKVAWSSSDPSVATVDQNGKVTAVADTGIADPASAVITVTTNDGKYTASCTVTVEDPVNAFVRRLYDLCFGRKADSGGFNMWTSGLRTKKYTAAFVVQAFFTSNEMKNMKLPNEEWVERCYLVMMNRASDAGGKKGWVNKLDIGMSQTYVLRGFVGSTEFNNVCKDYGVERGSVTISEPRDQNQGITEFVGRCYSEVLGRKAEVGGLNDWCKRILTASNRKQAAIDAASNGFFHSPEYLNKHTNNDQYVRTLYRTFLGREADQGGYNNWMKALNSGTSRDEVMKGFANSAEFAKIMAKYGIK